MEYRRELAIIIIELFVFVSGNVIFCYELWVTRKEIETDKQYY